MLLIVRRSLHATYSNVCLCVIPGLHNTNSAFFLAEFVSLTIVKDGDREMCVFTSGIPLTNRKKGCTPLFPSYTFVSIQASHTANIT